jgi:hypothetical protein
MQDSTFNTSSVSITLVRPLIFHVCATGQLLVYWHILSRYTRVYVNMYVHWWTGSWTKAFFAERRAGLSELSWHVE